MTDMTRPPTTEVLQVAYRTMRTIRSFEEKLVQLVNQGKLGGFLHVCIGQEAIAAAVCAHLKDYDHLASTHRGHGHCIAKGVDVRGMMAELFGRSTGTCRGRGGSMHIADLDRGMLGANGIVGAGIPLATGAALTAKLKKTGGVGVAMFGDGATNQGAFHESLNMAANWQLPAVYVCENNGWGEFTPTEFVVPVKDIAERARSYAMNSDIADGMDFFDVYARAGAAIARARRGEGPTLLECKTYRFLGHYVGDPLVYRSKDESEAWVRDRDPLKLFEARVTGEGLLAADNLRAIDEEVTALIADAVSAAEAAPFPDAGELLQNVFVNG